MSIYDYSPTAGSNTLIGGISIAEGCSPANLNNAIRNAMADLASFVDDTAGALTTGGTANAQTVTAASVTSLASGKRIGGVKAAASNTTAATLNVSALGAKAIRKYTTTSTDVALVAGDIVENARYDFIYDTAANGAAGAWILLNPSLGSLGGYQPLDATLTALAAYSTNGILTQTAADTFTGRAITGGTGITATNGDGVSGNPTIAIDPATVAVLTTNTFTGVQTISGNQPILTFNEGDAGSDEKNWRYTSAAGSLYIFSLNDALGGAVQADRIDRSGTTITKRTINGTEIELNATDLDFNGAADISGALTVGGDFTRVNITMTGSGSSGQLNIGTYSATGASNGWIASETQARHSTTSTGNVDHIALANPNGIVGSARTNGTGTSWLTTSDERLKDDFRPISDALGMLSRINMYDFGWKVDGTRSFGPKAQELHKVVPDAVGVGGDDPKTEPWGWDGSRLVPLIVAGIQELAARVTRLETPQAITR